MACLACQVAHSKCTVDNEPMVTKKWGLMENPESRSPKKARMDVPAMANPTVPLVDQDGRAAYKVTGERWTTESGAPEVRVEVSIWGQTRELLEEVVQVGVEQIVLQRETVELLKELRRGIRELNRTLRGSRVSWVAADDDEEREEGEVRETIKDD
jgi:hypothetical protein